MDSKELVDNTMSVVMLYERPQFLALTFEAYFLVSVCQVQESSHHVQRIVPVVFGPKVSTLNQN